MIDSVFFQPLQCVSERSEYSFEKPFELCELGSFYQVEGAGVGSESIVPKKPMATSGIDMGPSWY